MIRYKELGRDIDAKDYQQGTALLRPATGLAFGALIGVKRGFLKHLLAAVGADYEEPDPRNFDDFDRLRPAIRFDRYDANKLESERRNPAGFIASIRFCHRARPRCLRRNDGHG